MDPVRSVSWVEIRRNKLERAEEGVDGLVESFRMGGRRCGMGDGRWEMGLAVWGNERNASFVEKVGCGLWVVGQQNLLILYVFLSRFSLDIQDDNIRNNDFGIKEADCPPPRRRNESDMSQGRQCLLSPNKSIQTANSL